MRKPQALPPTERLVITTLSLLLAVNTHGHPEARFPQEELAAALGVDAGDLQLLQSYTRTEQIGGFIAHFACRDNSGQPLPQGAFLSST